MKREKSQSTEKPTTDVSLRELEALYLALIKKMHPNRSEAELKKPEQSFFKSEFDLKELKRSKEKRIEAKQSIEADLYQFSQEARDSRVLQMIVDLAIR